MGSGAAGEGEGKGEGVGGAAAVGGRRGLSASEDLFAALEEADSNGQLGAYAGTGEEGEQEREKKEEEEEEQQQQALEEKERGARLRYLEAEACGGQRAKDEDVSDVTSGAGVHCFSPGILYVAVILVTCSM